MITVFACSLVAGAIDDTSDRVNPAEWIFLIGLLVFAAHIVLFIYRSWKKQRKSKLVFWLVVLLSVFIIPIAYLMLAISAGMSCGFGASNGPTFLLVFELLGITAQIIAWRVLDHLATSPIPLN